MRSTVEVAAEGATRPARTWTDFSYVRWTGREVVKSRLGKVGFAKFLSESGLPHARILKSFSSAEAIDLAALPDSFVLKPASLWSSKGVIPAACE